MKSEKRIRELLEMYEFDREMDKIYFPETTYSHRDIVINILKWVLEDN